MKLKVTELRNQSRHVDALHDNLRAMEQSVARIRPGVAEVSATVAGLQRQVEVVAAGSDRAREAIEALATIDAALEEIEGRVQRLQVAREWLARTETRLTEISAGAQDQLRLLETVLKAERGDPPAPGDDADLELVRWWSSLPGRGGQSRRSPAPPGSAAARWS